MSDRQTQGVQIGLLFFRPRISAREGVAVCFTQGLEHGVRVVVAFAHQAVTPALQQALFILGKSKSRHRRLSGPLMGFKLSLFIRDDSGFMLGRRVCHVLASWCVTFSVTFNDPMP